MFLLRFLLIFAVVYYLLKFLGGLLLGKKKDRGMKPGSNGKKRNDSDYTGITDQKVDDADYEDL
ncbi:MAG: hypothetical protein KAV42_06985 [Candidatus Krumholzibacteria bacterium]|nr:hypothetical protein [Candidatus Krumholzibacteria bacterium]